MTAAELIEQVLARVDKAEADGSFYLRVNTWLTAGDGRDFCAQAPDDIRKLARMLKVALGYFEILESPEKYAGPRAAEIHPAEVAKTALAEIEKIAGEA